MASIKFYTKLVNYDFKLPKFTLFHIFNETLQALERK